MTTTPLRVIVAAPGESFVATPTAEAPAAAVVVVQPGDTLAEGAELGICHAFEHNPDLDGLIADSTVGDITKEYSLRLEPTWSPELLRHRPDHAATLVMRESAIERFGVPDSLSPAGIHQWALRLAEAGANIAHVPGVLVHRGADPWLDSADIATAVDNHLRRSRIAARAVIDDAGRCVTIPNLDIQPRVSVVIPTAGSTDGGEIPTRFLDRCLSTLAAHTNWAELEVVLVVDDNLSAEAVSRARQIIESQLKIVKRPTGDFNFSTATMSGALASTGELILMLNDDTEVPADSDPDWLAHMVVEAQRPDVGAVGAVLTYPDGTLQHAGLVIDDAAPLHALLNRSLHDPDVAATLSGPRRVAAVTGAALLVRRDRLFAVGGLSPTMPLSFNDVDLCLKLTRRGLYSVLVPAARLVHHESASREATVAKWEWDTWVMRWGEVQDPWYHPSYVRHHEPTARHLDAEHELPTSWPIMAEHPEVRRGVVVPRVHHPKTLPPADAVPPSHKEASSMPDTAPKTDPVAGDDLAALRSEVLRLRDVVEGVNTAMEVHLDRIKELEAELVSYHKLLRDYAALRSSPTFRLATVLSSPARLIKRGRLRPES